MHQTALRKLKSFLARYRSPTKHLSIPAPFTIAKVRDNPHNHLCQLQLMQRKLLTSTDGRRRIRRNWNLPGIALATKAGIDAAPVQEAHVMPFQDRRCHLG